MSQDQGWELGHRGERIMRNQESQAALVEWQATNRKVSWVTKVEALARATSRGEDAQRPAELGRGPQPPLQLAPEARPASGCAPQRSARPGRRSRAAHGWAGLGPARELRSSG
jgi:hypothetical protein